MIPQDYQRELLGEAKVEGPPLGLLIILVASFVLGLALTALLMLLA